MTQITLIDPQNGEDGDASVIAANNTELESAINGGLDEDNLESGTFLELLAKGTDRKVAFGIATLAWPGGSSFSTALNVNHGLGTTPLCIQVTVLDPTLVAGFPTIGAQSRDATKFVAQGETNNGASPTSSGTCTFSWLAIA